MNRFNLTHNENMAGSRFFNNDSVELVQLISHCTDQVQELAKGKHVLSLYDTSEINCQSHAGKLSKQDTELGPVGNNKDIGFFIHPSLVVDARTGFPLGISSIQMWNRKWGKETKSRDHREEPIEEKETYRWLHGAQESAEHLQTASSITVVGDRESDIYESFAMLSDQGIDLLTRAKHNRSLPKNEQKLFDHLSGQAISGHYSLKVAGDSRTHRSTRLATMDVRYCEVVLKCPRRRNKEGYPPELTLYAIEAIEQMESIPNGEEAIHWRLLTTHKINELPKALLMLDWYSKRWLIEELFRILKSEGLELESSQLESGKALKKLAVMSLQVALQILQMKQERQGENQVQASIIFDKQEEQIGEAIMSKYEGKTAKLKNPYKKGSLARMVWLMARIGGWKGYVSSGLPGVITLKKGWQQFQNIAQGVKIAKSLDMYKE